MTSGHMDDSAAFSAMKPMTSQGFGHPGSPLNIMFVEGAASGALMPMYQIAQVKQKMVFVRTVLFS